MARRLRIDVGGLVYHVINRRAGRLELFEDDADYLALEKVIAEVCAEKPNVRIVGYCLMPNHWHLVLWPKNDGELSAFMQRLTVTHMRRWHAHRASAGTGPLYQGRFKSFPIEQDPHCLTVCRYVERNALRAGLVRRAQNWRWCSLSKRLLDEPPPWLLAMDQWPVQTPSDWETFVDEPQSSAEIAALRRSVNRGTPFGSAPWQHRTAMRLKLQSSLRDPWRPKKQAGQLKHPRRTIAKKSKGMRSK